MYYLKRHQTVYMLQSKAEFSAQQKKEMSLGEAISLENIGNRMFLIPERSQLCSRLSVRNVLESPASLLLSLLSGKGKTLHAGCAALSL